MTALAAVAEDDEQLPAEVLLPALLAEAVGELTLRDPQVAELARREVLRRRRQLDLVAASCPTLPAASVAQALGFAALTAEGYPGRRFHPGTELADELERLAVERACRLFGAPHANVQPLSATAANLAVLGALVPAGGSVLAMELAHGGHLSHVSRPASVSRRMRATYYGVGEAGAVDLEQVRALARTTRPDVVVCGGSSYPRAVDFAGFRAVADEVGALLLADVSHVSGLIAAGVLPSPVQHADIVSTSTYKQLLGPHGGLLLVGGSARVVGGDVDRAVFPGFQGTPDFGTIAAKAVAFSVAETASFAEAMRRVVQRAAMLSSVLTASGLRVVSGGTDTHMVLVDVGAAGASGAAVSAALESVGVLANKNLVPGDRRSAAETSGLRLGTNHLGFMACGDAELTDLGEAIAALVRELGSGRQAAACRSLGAVRDTAAAVISAGYLPEWECLRG